MPSPTPDNEQARLGELGSTHDLTWALLWQIALPPLAALGLQWYFWASLEPYAFLLFYPAVFLSSRLGGRIAGLGATVVSMGFMAYFFLPPVFSFAVESRTGLVGLAVFCGMGLLFGEVQERLRKTSEQAADALAAVRSAKEHLEDRVKERTAELSKKTEELKLEIAERERAQARANASIEAMPDGVVVVNSEGNISLVNAQTEALFGYGEDELLGQALVMLVPERSREIHRGHCEGFLASGETRAMGLGLELYGRRKDGSEFPVDIRLGTMEIGGQRSAIAIVRDVTERKQAEEVLRKQEATLSQFKFTLDQTLDCVFMFHPDTLRFIYCNKGAMQQVGYTEAELFAMTPLDLKPGFTEPTFRAMVQPLRDGSLSSHVFETIHRHKDGHDVPVEVSLQLVQGDRQSGRFVAGVRDITERKRAEEALRNLNTELEQRVQERTAEFQKAKEEAEEANNSKSEFLSRMSHELRTPLNAVLGYAQLLGLQYEDPKIKEATASISAGGKHLLKMIDEVLDLSRIESGKFTLSFEPVAVAEVIRYAIDLLQPLADEADIKLGIENQCCDEMHVQADRQRLLQVFINLLGNAIKYNRAGGKVIVRCAELADGISRIEISDTGHGIAPEDQKLLFQPFSRFGGQGVEGTGLGLPLSERFVKLMKGNLGLLESTPFGSTFFIDLVRSDAEYQKLATPDCAEPSSELPKINGTVLYIEDNLSNFRLIELFFADWEDLVLIPAAQGLVGLELARQYLPDLILLDLNLPDMMGDQVLRQLKADPATKSIPVFILTADATRRQIKALRAGGAAEYLTKPLDLQRLLKVMAKHLRTKE